MNLSIHSSPLCSTPRAKGLRWIPQAAAPMAPAAAQKNALWEWGITENDLQKAWESSNYIYYVYHIKSYHIKSYHIISTHIISYHIISNHHNMYQIKSYHIISNHIISYIKSNHIISHHIISNHNIYQINTYRVLQKKQPSHEVPHHRGHAPPVPQFNVVFWILCLAAFKKKSHFCWWCSALPITTLKLGVRGKQGISVVSCGWLFFLKNPVSFFGFRVHFNCCWYVCGCRSARIHTHQCDNISFWNLRIVQACASVICDSPIKVDAKG